MVEAPREVIHDEVFNVGSTAENYQIRDVASIVEDAVSGASFEMAGTAGPDIRDYRVNCDKLKTAVPSYETRWTVASGAAELVEAFRRFGLTEEQFLGSLLRIKHIKGEQDAGRLDDDLRPIGGRQHADAGI
jgi:hypothetical protein